MLRHVDDEDTAMARYESQRDAAIAEVFALTRALGAFPPMAEALEIQARLRTALDVEAQALAARPAPVGGLDRDLVDVANKVA